MANDTADVMTDERIARLADEAGEAGDLVQVALCWVVMGEEESLERLLATYPDVRQGVERLGGLEPARARQLCLRALDDARVMEGT
jgi:hypothetical protein